MVVVGIVFLFAGPLWLGIVLVAVGLVVGAYGRLGLSSA
jgi:hypothetical protein